MKRQKTESLPPSATQNTAVVAIPPQLKSIIQKEWVNSGEGKKAPPAPIHVMVRSIEKAKQNELKAYLTMCQVRLQIPSRPTPPPPQQ
jgi:hypothetical protein